jgi:hypothetical protein
MCPRCAPGPSNVGSTYELCAGDSDWRARVFLNFPCGDSAHNWQVDAKHVQANLKFLLNEWDPLGVAYLAPDEYDCMIAPLLSRLIRGESRAEISEFLWYELEAHFGTDPLPRDVDGMANRLVAWWAAVGSDLAS